MPDERLLLAAFGSGERAARAWSDWSQGRDLGALEPAELRLLPPIYHNLRAAGVTDAAIPAVVKQMARSLWVRTRLMLREAAATIALFTAHDVDSVLLKGAALVAAGYCDAGVRPMADFDLLVHPADVTRAASLLQAEGWQPERRLTPHLIRYRHAVAFQKLERGCDLHWWTLWESRDANADARFRQGAEPAVLDGVPVRVLRPEHLLLHVIVHGTRAFDAATVRWIGDALAVLRTRGHALDWRLFVEEANARRLAYPLGEALAYLVDTFGASVPAEAIGALRASPVARWRRRLYSPRPNEPRQPPMPYFLRYSWLASPDRTPLLMRLLRFPGNVRLAQRADSFGHLALAMTRRGVRKVAAMLWG